MIRNIIAWKQFNEIGIIIAQEYYCNAEIAVTRKYETKQIICFCDLLFLLPSGTVFISKAYNTCIKFCVLTIVLH